MNNCIINARGGEHTRKVKQVQRSRESEKESEREREREIERARESDEAKEENRRNRGKREKERDTERNRIREMLVSSYLIVFSELEQFQWDKTRICNLRYNSFN